MMRAAKQPPSVQSVREVAQDVQGAVWSEISTRLLRGLRALLEGLLEDEMTTHVGAVSAVMQYSLPVVIENSLPSNHTTEGGEKMGKLTYNCASLPEQTAHREVTMVGEEQWEEIHRLFTIEKWSKSAVARELNVDVKTVRRCLRRAAWVPYQRAPRPETRLTAHAELVHHRAPEVGYSARILFQKLVHQHGYTGSYETVKRFVRPLRDALMNWGRAPTMVATLSSFMAC